MQCRLGRYFSNLRPTTHTFDHCASQVGQWRTTDLSEEWSRSRTYRAIWDLCRDQMDAKEVHFQLWWRQLYYSYTSPTWICGLHARLKMMDRRGNGGVGWRCRAGSELLASVWSLQRLQMARKVRLVDHSSDRSVVRHWPTCVAQWSNVRVVGRRFENYRPSLH